MLSSGLVSVSFRDMAPSSIIDAAKQAGLQGIEWGGDVHVPAGDYRTAREVRVMTFHAGLRIFSYGSYYRIGCEENPAKEFSKVLSTAVQLEAPIIRVWGYDQGSASIDKETFGRLVEETAMLGELARREKICISLECHNGTITDEYHSALRFMNAVGQPNVRMYWQPNQFRDETYNLDALRNLGPFITNIHVFHWDRQNRFPLCKGETIWRQYLKIIQTFRGDHALLLEFMHDDCVNRLPDTAKTLNSWM